MYAVYQTEGFQRRTVARVATIEEGRAFLAGWGELVCFEPDPDGHDAADAALVRKTGALEIYAIERD